MQPPMGTNQEANQGTNQRTNQDPASEPPQHPANKPTSTPAHQQLCHHMVATTTTNQPIHKLAPTHDS